MVQCAGRAINVTCPLRLNKRGFRPNAIEAEEGVNGDCSGLFPAARTKSNYERSLFLFLSRSTRTALVSFGVHTRLDNSRIWTAGANSIHDRLSLAHELLISLIYIMFHRDVSFVRCGEFPFAPPTGSNAIEFSRVSPDQIASAR